MKLTTLVLCVFLTGCALGRITPEGIQGFAVGHAALVQCNCPPQQNVLTAALTSPPCSRIEGGALSSSLIELLSTIATGMLAYFTAGAP